MAKLPPKPRNPVHEFFPVGADGQSPMNFVGPKQVEEGDKPEEIANRFSLGGEHDVVPTKKIDYYKDNPIVDDPDNPGKKIRKKDLEARKKSESVEVGEGASNELDEVVLTPNNKVIGPGLGETLTKKKNGTRPTQPLQPTQPPQGKKDTPGKTSPDENNVGVYKPPSKRQMNVWARQNYRTSKVAARVYKKQEKEKEKEEIQRIRAEEKKKRENIKKSK